MVGLVVDHDDVLLFAQLTANTAHHLVRGLGEGAGTSVAQNLLGDFGGLPLLAQLEGVEVGDEYLGLAQFRQQVRTHHVHLAVVVVGVAGKEDTQPVTDGDARGHYQERVGEAGVLWVGDLVECVPGDEHGHDDRFATSGGHLEGDAVEKRVGVGVALSNVVFDPSVAVLPGDLGDVDGCLQGLDLAEEQPEFTVGTLPVFK